MKQTIALVDDDRNILTSLSIALEKEGFKVQTYIDGESALIGLTRNPPDLAILDIKMPRLDGLEVLQKLRNSSDIPVIFLTSKDDEIDQLLGLKMGADDYITKPFSQKLLIERVKVILKRTAISNNKNIGKNDSLIERGNLLLNMDRHECHWKNERIKLTVTEFLLLESLVNRPGYVKNRDQLMSAAYSDDLYVDDRTIDSHIKRIRRKFKAIDNDFNSIETLYGVGYRFNQ